MIECRKQKFQQGIQMMDKSNFVGCRLAFLDSMPVREVYYRLRTPYIRRCITAPPVLV